MGERMEETARELAQRQGLNDKTEEVSMWNS